MASRINWAMRGKRGKKSKRRTENQETGPRPRDRGIAKMAELYTGIRGKGGTQEPSLLGERFKVRGKGKKQSEEPHTLLLGLLLNSKCRGNIPSPLLFIRILDNVFVMP